MQSPISKVKPILKIDWATHKAAKFSVENWHYSGCMPAGKLVKIGVWEDQKFIGCVMFGRGANNNLGKPYKLAQTEICELVRVALTRHVSSVTKIVSIAMKFLKKQSPKLRLIVSYADPIQGHHGGIYQGGNWVYTGRSQAQAEVVVNGKIMHKRTANALFGTIKGLKKSPVLWKHKYLFALDKKMRERISELARPYPKRGGSIDNDAADNQSEEGGVIPTPSLQG